MTRLHASVLVVSVALAGIAAAQDPFDAPVQPAAPRPAAKAASPADPTQPEPLAIEILRSSNPTTPLQLIQAAQAALQFGRPDETKRYLAKLLASNPAEEALA